MTTTNDLYQIELPNDSKIVRHITGPNDRFLQMISESFGGKIKLKNRNIVVVNGATAESQKLISSTIERLKEFEAANSNVTEADVLDAIEKVKDLAAQPMESLQKNVGHNVIVYGPNEKNIRAKTDGQQELVDTCEKNDITFAIGPAGSGKTYTAVALAVRALKNKEVRKIILTRPAVEAGENLGFLPGDLKDKIDPYLRPLYDALDDMIPADKLNYYMTNRVIEVAPLAYMRGRTLDNAFIILDEAQNTTDSQLKMFLTRIGANAKAIITGDTSQVDLPKNMKSGLEKATNILKDVNGIGMVKLNGSDIVRHKLVKEIVAAYEKFDQNEEEILAKSKTPAANQNNLTSTPAVN